MNSDFVITLKKVRFSKSNFPEAPDLLEDQSFELQKLLAKNQLARPKTTKRFAMNSFNEIVDVEARIKNHYDFIYSQAQSIPNKAKERSKAENKRGIFLTTEESANLKKLETEIEYFSRVLGCVDDAKHSLIEYLAGYDPKRFANDPNLFDLMLKTLPAWNVIRRTVIKLKNERGFGAKFSYSEYAAALKNQGISINHKGHGVNDGIDYVTKFGLKPGRTLYNRWNELDHKKEEKFKAKADEIIKLFKLSK